MRAAGCYLLNQIESGVYCPLAMTYGAVPTLRHAPKIAEEWLPKILAPATTARFIPIGEKTGALIGMGLTENQGGSDLRTNTTRAEPAGGGFRLHGHKWFLSVPMCDAFLVLAQSPKGLSCFFMPRWTPDGERNALRINRLKDKLGNKSNASSEVEFDGAYAQLVGEEGRGIPIMIEMAGYTRLDCCIGSSVADAPGGDAGGASRAPSHGVPEKARRSAADDQRARRSRARMRGGDRARHAAGARL